MGLIAWVVLGGIAGWLASIVAGTNAKMGVLANIAVGIVGSFLGGWIFRLAGGAGMTGFNLYSLLVATVGATALIIVVRAIRR